ncbi:MAG TPA: glycosyltransferase family 1 protein [Isosphaeraceae bacterium]|nr:glycosyltransferase family 1 protein [Isosphaeraceae bacterium]
MNGPRLVIDGRRLSGTRTGVGRYLEGLLAEWATTGLPLAEVVVVLADRSGIARVPEAPGLRAVVVGEGWPGLVWERFGLGRVLRRGDLLFAPTNLVPSCWKGPTVLVVFDTLLASRPGDFPWHARLRFAARYRRSARRAEVIITLSEATARDVVHQYRVPYHRIRVIPPGVDPHFRPLGPDAPEVAAARRAIGLGPGPFFLFVGKRSRRRHLPEILAAFERFGAHVPGHRLVLVGPRGRDGECRRDGVLDAGHVDEETLVGLYAGALALLYPSEMEGFGLPVVEAMAAGCPVITRPVGALLEAAGDAAYPLDAASAGHIERAMLNLAEGPDRRAALVAAGIAHARRFDRAGAAWEVTKAIMEAAVIYLNIYLIIIKYF